jgi:NADH-quinone oxidoreductase E subunit
MIKEFSKDMREEVDKLLDILPNRKAALLPVLRIAEEKFGFIDSESCRLVASILGLSPSYVYGTLTFYTHYKREFHGKYRIMVCSTLMCSLRNSKGILEHIKSKLGIDVGEKTKDGKFSIEKVECLASCGTAPSIQINDTFYEDMTTKKVDEILDSLE